MKNRGLCLRGLFSPGEDFLGFVAPTLFAVAATLILAAQGKLFAAVGPLSWLFLVVMIDVAHVYATAYRVYADPRELVRRKRLYLLVPLCAYAASVGFYFLGSQTFWRVLAYLAVFHFVRQQRGWVALCGRKEDAYTSWDRRLDALCVYVGTLYPLYYWHAHLPRRFHWFIDGDFLGGDFWGADFFTAKLFGLPVLSLLRGLYVAVLALWLLRQAQRVYALRSLCITRVVVMATTWLSWYLGIVYYDSDAAFTLLNVLPHGVPYLVLLFRYRKRAGGRAGEAPRSAPRGLALVAAAALFYLPLCVVSFVEEGIWDRLVWHEHGMLFPGHPVFLSELALCFVVPLLALPQATHYLLDAWIWKVGPQNPDLKRKLGL